MNVEITTLDKLDNRDFRRVVKLDCRNWWNVLSSEYNVGNISNFHERMKTVFYEEYKRVYSRLLEFPEGEVVAYCHDLKRPVGAISGIRINAPTIDDVPNTWHAMSDNGYFTTHDPKGNMLCCASIIVLNTGLPSERLSELKKQHISSMLLGGEHALAEKLGLPNLIGYSRPMNYAEYVAKHGAIDIEKYLEVRNDKGRLYDKSIGMHEREINRLVRERNLVFDAKLLARARIIPGGRPLDPQSLGYNIISDYSPTLKAYNPQEDAAHSNLIYTPVKANSQIIYTPFCGHPFPTNTDSGPTRT